MLSIYRIHFVKRNSEPGCLSTTGNRLHSMRGGWFHYYIIYIEERKLQIKLKEGVSIPHRKVENV